MGTVMWNEPLNNFLLIYSWKNSSEPNGYVSNFFHEILNELLFFKFKSLQVFKWIAWVEYKDADH